MWRAILFSVLLLGHEVARPGDGADFWIPVAFLVTGALLFLWELSMPGFFIAVAAVPMVILGIIGLMFQGFFTAGFIWPLLIGLIIVAPTMMITLRIYRSWAPPDAGPTTTSAESMTGREGTVTVPVDTETTKGKVRLHGTIWSARSETGVIPEGTRVRVERVQGVHVVVVPVEKEAPEPAPTGPSAQDPPQVGDEGEAGRVHERETS